MNNTLKGATAVTFQESIFFHISLVSDNGAPVGVMVAGNGHALSVCAYGGEFGPALAEIDQSLDDYQERNPHVKMIEVVSDEVMEVMNLMLESKRLKPISEDDFNFSDVLFWINNPVLAKQMGHGL